MAQKTSYREQAHAVLDVAHGTHSAVLLDAAQTLLEIMRIDETLKTSPDAQKLEEALTRLFVRA
jgi:hypothetical protein